jgi:hypothetical protein
LVLQTSSQARVNRVMRCELGRASYSRRKPAKPHTAVEQDRDGGNDTMDRGDEISIPRSFRLQTAARSLKDVGTESPNRVLVPENDASVARIGGQPCRNGGDAVRTASALRVRRKRFENRANVSKTSESSPERRKRPQNGGEQRDDVGIALENEEV